MSEYMQSTESRTYYRLTDLFGNSIIISGVIESVTRSASPAEDNTRVLMLDGRVYNVKETVDDIWELLLENCTVSGQSGGEEEGSYSGEDYCRERLASGG
jgi:hypothetical protein